MWAITNESPIGSAWQCQSISKSKGIPHWQSILAVHHFNFAPQNISIHLLRAIFGELKKADCYIGGMQLLKANPAVKDERLFNTIEEYILKYKLLMRTLVHTVHLLSSKLLSKRPTVIICNTPIPHMPVLSRASVL
jgi:hypothetical protein